MSGFIMIYRWRVAAEIETLFRERWAQLTELARDHGALGSCLTRAATGELVAIALWPDEATRARAFEAISLPGPWPEAERLDEMRLDVLEDLWTSSPFAATAMRTR